MKRDSKAFRLRFLRWKNGDKVYDNGRPTDLETMERIAEENWLQWGEPNVDVALMHALNDPSYDYKGYYNKYPNSRANASTHWTDEFKLPQHRSFSNQSKYSGKVSKLNPYGITGGFWYNGDAPKMMPWSEGEEKFFPHITQRSAKALRNLPAFEDGTEDDHIYNMPTMREVVVTPSGSHVAPISSDDMLFNLEQSIDARRAKDRRDAYTLLRNMNRAQEAGAKAVGLSLAAAGGVPALMSSAPAIGAAIGNIATPGSSFWTNPLTKLMVTGTLAAEGVNLAVKALTGYNTVGEGVGASVEKLTGWNPNNTWLGPLVTEALNPGWYLNPSRITDPVGKIGSAIENKAQKAWYKWSGKELDDAYAKLNRVRKEAWDLELQGYKQVMEIRKKATQRLRRLDYLYGKAPKSYIEAAKSDPNPHAKLFHNVNRIGFPNISKMSDTNMDRFFGKDPAFDGAQISKLFNRDAGVFEVPYLRTVMGESGGTWFDAQKAVTTGDVRIPDFATGQIRSFYLDPAQITPGGQSIYSATHVVDPSKPWAGPYIKSEANINIPSKIVNPVLPEGYAQALQNNLDYVTSRILPGSKAFGSTPNIIRGNLYHSAHDIDVIMTEAAARQHPDFSKWSQLRPDTYSGTFGSAGDIDVNVIREANGRAYGPLAHEIYSQFYPKRYRDYMLKLAQSKTKLTPDVPLDISSQELLDAYDPVVKGIMDAFSSDKEKHAARALYYLNNGHVEDVRRGFDAYMNYILGGEYHPTNVSLSEFADPAMNSALIDEMGFEGIAKQLFINNPERMKLLFDYYVSDKTFLGRGVDRDVLAGVIPSFTHWFPERNGGSAYGAGLNTVVGGNSGHGDLYASLMPPKMTLPTSNTTKQVMNEVHKHLGVRTLTREDALKVQEFAKQLDIPGFENIDAGTTLYLVLLKTANKEGLKYAQFLKLLADHFDTSVIMNTYGTYNDLSPYASVLEDFAPNGIKLVFVHGVDRPMTTRHRESLAKGAGVIDSRSVHETNRRLADNIANYIDSKYTLAHISKYNLAHTPPRFRYRTEGLDLLRFTRSSIDSRQLKESSIILKRARDSRHERLKSVDRIEESLSKKYNKFRKSVRMALSGAVIGGPIGLMILAHLKTKESREKRHLRWLERQKELQNDSIPGYEDGKESKWSNSTIGAAVAENPAIMTASGWKNKDDLWIQDPDVQTAQLANSLANISMMSPTHPINATLSGAFRLLVPYVKFNPKLNLRKPNIRPNLTNLEVRLNLGTDLGKNKIIFNNLMSRDQLYNLAESKGEIYNIPNLTISANTNGLNALELEGLAARKAAAEFLEFDVMPRMRQMGHPNVNDFLYAPDVGDIRLLNVPKASTKVGGWNDGFTTYLVKANKSNQLDEIAVHEFEHQQRRNMGQSLVELSNPNTTVMLKARLLLEVVNGEPIVNYGYTPQEKEILNSAYKFSKDFLKHHPNIEQIAEMGATNRQMRYALSKRFGGIFGKELDDVIGKLDIEDIERLLEEGNSYSRSFLQSINEEISALKANSDMSHYAASKKVWDVYRPAIQRALMKVGMGAGVAYTGAKKTQRNKPLKTNK